MGDEVLFFDDWGVGSDLPAGKKLIDPISSAAWLDAGSKVLGGMFGGPKNTSSSATSVVSSAFDSSGWTVNYGSGSVEASRSQSSTGWQTYALLAFGMVLAWKTLKH